MIEYRMGYSVSCTLVDAVNNYVQGINWGHSVEAPETFAALRDVYKKRRIVLVSSLYSDRTIWGPRELNWQFRAWHDHTHLALGLPFNREGERAVAWLQRQQAYAAGCRALDLQLLWADTEGQQEYHARHGRFPTDQRDFVQAYVIDPQYALAKGDW